MFHFEEYSNELSKDRIKLIATTIRYFRICVMNPTLKDYIDDWWNKFTLEYNEYKAKFEDYVNKRAEKILSISQTKGSEDQVKELNRTGKKIVSCNRFEPRGRIHIAQAKMTVLNAKLLLKNDCRVNINIGDIFAKLNRKLGGDMKKIRDVGVYIIEVFKALGIQTSELIENDPHYWERVLDILMLTRDQKAGECYKDMCVDHDDKLFVT